MLGLQHKQSKKRLRLMNNFRSTDRTKAEQWVKEEIYQANSYFQKFSEVRECPDCSQFFIYHPLELALGELEYGDDEDFIDPETSNIMYGPLFNRCYSCMGYVNDPF